MLKDNQDESVTVHVGDCRHILASLPDKSVNCCVTSPPYWGLRDYGHADQIGMEKTPEEYVAKMVGVFREVRRVLRDDGTLWLNLGDSYNAAGRDGHGTRVGYKQGTNRASATGGDACRPSADSLKPKDLIGIPWRVAFALQADGWYLRQDIIWAKPNPMPESVRDRCTKAHEYVFLLSKSEKYYYDQDAIKEPVAEDTNARYERGRSDSHKYSDGGPGGQTIAKSFSHMKKSGSKKKSWGTNETDDRTEGSGQVETQRGIPWEGSVRNKRSVWTITTKPFKGAHFATMPPELAETCVLAGCPEGGTVLDPFGGSGTTAGVAKKHWRKAIICELNEDYTKLIPDRVDSIAGSAPLFDGREDTMSLFSDQE